MEKESLTKIFFALLYRAAPSRHFDASWSDLRRLGGSTESGSEPCSWNRITLYYRRREFFRGRDFLNLNEISK